MYKCHEPTKTKTTGSVWGTVTKGEGGANESLENERKMENQKGGAKKRGSKEGGGQAKRRAFQAVHINTYSEGAIKDKASIPHQV